MYLLAQRSTIHPTASFLHEILMLLDGRFVLLSGTG
jgi:hypothetical protein